MAKKRENLARRSKTPARPAAIPRLDQFSQWHSLTTSQVLMLSSYLRPRPPQAQKDDNMTREERRADPEKVLFRDLEEGDRLYLRDENRETVVTRIDGSSIHIKGGRRDPIASCYVANDDTLHSCDVTLLLTPIIASQVKFEDVVLPAKDKDAILDAIKQIDHFDLIFNKWGFGEVLEKGRAVSLLFYGEPGTGKTLMAQAVADHFGYKLKVISTAEIESSEPGQAERNIKAYFDAANRDKKTVLLFDECDSLIADRRGIGMILGAQVNALLTGLEKFEGIAIFTTNRLEKMDEAFNRRLSLKMKFNRPTREQRVQIWRRMFPAKAPLAKDVDFAELAEFDITGGYIKNVVLRSARKAANSKEKQITQRILAQSLVEEVETLTEFQEAVDSNTTPRLRTGGGHEYRKGVL